MFNFDHLGCKLKYGRERLWGRYCTHQNKTACFRRLWKQHIFLTSFRQVHKIVVRLENAIINKMER